MALLEVKDLEVDYGVIRAIKGISFKVEQGEIVTLIGANGAGKTTTMQSIMGLIQPKSGTVTYEGQLISGFDDKNRHVSVPTNKIVRMGMTQVPEGRHVFAELTVYENLVMGGYLEKSRQKVKSDIDDIYDLFPRLGERRNQLAGMLSGGEQQMLAMGRALMSHPKLMMLDEPSMGLAPILVQQIFDIIKKLHEGGTTILLVEQNAEMALKIADRAYVMETGEITLSGSGEELAQSDEIKKAYLGG